MLRSTDTAFEVKLPDSVLAGVRAKSEQLHLAGKRLVSDAEWSKLQHEVRCFKAVTAFALFCHAVYYLPTGHTSCHFLAYLHCGGLCDQVMCVLPVVFDSLARDVRTV